MKNATDVIIKHPINEGTFMTEPEEVGVVGAAVDSVGAAVEPVGAAVDSVGAAVDSVGAAVDTVGVAVVSLVAADDSVPVLKSSGFAVVGGQKTAATRTTKVKRRDFLAKSMLNLVIIKC